MDHAAAATAIQARYRTVLAQRAFSERLYAAFAADGAPPKLEALEAELMRPRSRRPSASSTSEDDAASPMPGRANHRAGAGKSVWALRDRVYAATKLLKIDAKVHMSALTALQEPTVTQWIVQQCALPGDVLGVAIVRATLRKLEHDETVTDELLGKLCKFNTISMTTAKSAAEVLASLMTEAVSIESARDALF